MAKPPKQQSNAAAPAKPAAPPAVLPKVGDIVLATDERGDYAAIVSRVDKDGVLGLHVLIPSEAGPVLYHERVEPARWRLREVPTPAPERAMPTAAATAAAEKPKRTFGQML